MYNKLAFSGIHDRRYVNWDGPSLVYTHPFLKAIEDHIDLNTVHTIFDIGSRDACQAMEFTDWFPMAEVHLFEPIPSSYNFCTEQTKYRNKVTCNNTALSDYSGLGSFYEVYNGNIGASSLYQTTEHTNRTQNWQQREITVAIETGEDYIKHKGINPPCILWMDTQGAELACLRGFGDYLSDVKAAHIEVGIESLYVNGTNYNELISFMDANNFKQLLNLDHGSQQEVDVIFVNKKYCSDKINYI